MDRYDKRALIALGMVLLAIVSLALIESLADSPASQPPTYATGSALDDQGEYERTPPREAAPHSFNWFHDSMAQWLMAIFTAAATAISLFAVRLVNATLKTNITATNATIEAVATAKEIGARQLRPYILYDSATIGKLQATGG